MADKLTEEIWFLKVWEIYSNKFVISEKLAKRMFANDGRSFVKLVLLYTANEVLFYNKNGATFFVAYTSIEIKRYWK